MHGGQMSEDLTYLKEAIFEYITKNNGELDSVDIATYFKLRADITLGQVSKLEDDGRIYQTMEGVQRRYFVSK